MAETRMAATKWRCILNDFYTFSFSSKFLGRVVSNRLCVVFKPEVVFLLLGALSVQLD